MRKKAKQTPSVHSVADMRKEATQTPSADTVVSPLSKTASISRRDLSPRTKMNMESVNGFTQKLDDLRLARAVRKRRMHRTNESWDELVKHCMFLCFFTICMSRTLHKQDHYWVGRAIKSQAVEMEFLPTDVANWGKAFQDIATVQEFEQVSQSKTLTLSASPFCSRK
jgi:hypothetical protein